MKIFAFFGVAFLILITISVIAYFWANYLIDKEDEY